MKKMMLYALLLMIGMPSFAQNKAIEDIFDKFEGKNGVTSVNISKDLMGLAAQMDSNDLKAKNLISQLSSIKVLALEKASSEDRGVFENMVAAIPLKGYHELLTVNKMGEKVKILSKETNGKVTEILLLVTGFNNSVLLSILGNIDPKEMGKLSKCMKLDGMEHLAMLDKKK